MIQVKQPAFSDPQVIDAKPEDGYWVHAMDIDGDGNTDLVASGLTKGSVVWYKNPGKKDRTTAWTKHEISVQDKGGVKKPVAMDIAVLDGNSHPDIALCHDYGQCMFNCGKEDGKISWLTNPGNSGGAWQREKIGTLVATHRLRLGHFTPTGKLQLAAFPVVGPTGGKKGVGDPALIKLYENSSDGEWTSTVIDDQKFRIVHAIVARKFPGTPRPDLDSFIVAGKEGLAWLGYGSDGKWVRKPIGSGATPAQQSSEIPYEFQGTGNVAIGRVGGQEYACMLTVEPFHGNILAAYTRPWGVKPFDRPWNRTVVRQFKQPVYGKDGQPKDAVGHHVVAADFDGDGDDEFLVAMRGPDPQGVFYYKFSPAGKVLIEQQISTDSAARIAVADFDRDGRLDFATTTYETEGYYKAGNPKVRVFYNDITGAHKDDPKAPPGADG
ncbi:FG-GAP repeat domain-containing protein [Streptomyces regalis]|nr:VCBS repeat-containing protein [Streptomyces regalis]